MADTFSERRPPRRRGAERTGSTVAPPVFFDPTSKRWHRSLATVVVLEVLAAGSLA